MPFRRRKQKKGHAAQTAVPSGGSPIVPSEEAIKGPCVPPLLVSSVEKASDIARLELSDTGRITPRALFVYDEESHPRITVVSLLWRNEFEKDALRKKIREKALQENARVVVVAGIQPMEPTSPLTFSGMTPETEVNASVDYTFDGGTRTISHWELRWSSASSSNLFRRLLPDWSHEVLPT